MNLRFVLAAALLCASAPLAAQTPGVALKGHDPVSYFTDGRPVKGSTGINYDFDERRYLFASQKNRERFAASPDRYTPQFAGLCTTGLAHGMKAEADPAVWKIIDGKLYVFSSTQAREKAEQDPGLLAKAQQNWRTVK
jgi:YHS domain-containing protein